MQRTANPRTAVRFRFRPPPQKPNDNGRFGRRGGEFSGRDPAFHIGPCNAPATPIRCAPRCAFAQRQPSEDTWTIATESLRPSMRQRCAKRRGGAIPPTSWPATTNSSPSSRRAPSRITGRRDSGLARAWRRRPPHQSGRQPSAHAHPGRVRGAVGGGLASSHRDAVRHGPCVRPVLPPDGVAVRAVERQRYPGAADHRVVCLLPAAVCLIAAQAIRKRRVESAAKNR